MTQKEIEVIIDRLKQYTKNTLLTEVSIGDTGKIELEIEIESETKLNVELLKSILEYINEHIQLINTNGNILLNSLFKVKQFRMSSNKTAVDFNLVGISMLNKESIHNQFKLVYDYDSELTHKNEDTLGYRTINFSGTTKQYYISGTNWQY